MFLSDFTMHDCPKHGHTHHEVVTEFGKGKRTRSAYRCMKCRKERLDYELTRD